MEDQKKAESNERVYRWRDSKRSSTPKVHKVPTERKCSKCKVTKPIEDYWRDNTQSCGYSYKCKKCERQRAKDRVKVPRKPKVKQVSYDPTERQKQVVLDIPPKTWMPLANCRNKGFEVFFEKYAEPAKLICTTCVVRTECLEYAIQYENATDGDVFRSGVFGGLSATQRNELVKQRKSDNSAI